MTTYEKIKNCGTDRWVCPVCGGHRDAKGKMCENCRKKFREENIGQPGCRNVKRPSRETLKKLIRTESFVGIGRMYGVSDNAIRKWCKAEGLPVGNREIGGYSQREWDAL